MVALIRDEKEAVAPIVTKHTLRGRVEGKSVMFKVVGRSLVFEASELNDSNSFKRVSTALSSLSPRIKLLHVPSSAQLASRFVKQLLTVWAEPLSLLTGELGSFRLTYTTRKPRPPQYVQVPRAFIFKRMSINHCLRRGILSDSSRTRY